MELGRKERELHAFASSEKPPLLAEVRALAILRSVANRGSCENGLQIRLILRR
jgi:hypothetical protein